MDDTQNKEQILAQIHQESHIEVQMDRIYQLFQDQTFDDRFKLEIGQEFVKLWTDQGLIDQALAILNQMVTCWPQASLYFQIARLCLLQGDPEKTLLYIGKIDHLTYETLLLQGQAYWAQNKYLEAKKIFQQLVQAEVTNYRAYEEMAQLSLEMANYSSAQFYYQTLWDYFISEAPYKRKECRLKLMDLMVNSEWLKLDDLLALANDPALPLDTGDEYYLLALGQYSAGMLDQALESVKLGLMRDGDHFELALLKWELLLETYLDQPSELHLNLTVESLNELIAIIPDYDSVIMDLLGGVQNLEVYPAPLINKLELIQDLVEDTLQSYQLLKLLVLGYLQNQDPSLAKQALESSELWQDIPEYLDYLSGRLFYAEGNYPAAIHKFMECYEAGIDEEDLIYYLGLSYIASGQIEKAREWVELIQGTVKENRYPVDRLMVLLDNYF